MKGNALAVIATGLGLLLFLTAGATTQLLNPAFGIWFTEIFVFFGLGWVLLRASGREPLRFTGLAHGAPLPALFGFVLAVANFFAFVVPIQFAMQAISPEWLLRMFDSSALFEGQTPVELALIVAGVSIAAPVCEEFFFRGLVQNSLMPPYMTRVGAVLLTSAIFSAFHLDPVGFLARVELGILFGVLLVRTGSLWPSILAHSANNLVSSTLFLLARDVGVSQAEAETDPGAVLIFASMGGLAMWGLLALARNVPALWGPGALHEPDALSTERRPPVLRLLLPWVLGATLALVGLMVVDARGVRLSLLDTRTPLPRLEKNAPPERLDERARLKELRDQARRGEVPMEEYQRERVRLAEQHRRLPELPVPAPAPLPPGEGAGPTGSGSETR